VPTHPSTRARWSRSTVVLAVAVSLVLSGAAAPTLAPAEAAPRWASPATATIHPGTQVITDGAQCTVNFVFLERDRVLLGMAAHCAATGSATQTDGCRTRSLPLGTKVDIVGARHPGVLVYSSWRTMQLRGERDPARCSYNDFALVRVDRRDVHRVNPSVPSMGGPTRLGSRPAAFERIYSYGNSSLRGGLPLLRPKTGVSLGSHSGEWSHTTYAVTPGIPGDSGSGYLNRSGEAFGVLSTLGLTPYPASNGVTDLRRALRYANVQGGRQATLVPGTVPFRPPL